MSAHLEVQSVPNSSGNSLPKVSSCSIQPQNGSEKMRQSGGQNDCLTLNIQVR